MPDEDIEDTYDIRPAEEAQIVNFQEDNPWLARLYIGDYQAGFEFPLTPATLPPLLDQLTAVAVAQKVPSQWPGLSVSEPEEQQEEQAEKSAVGRAAHATAQWTGNAAKTVSGKKMVDKAWDHPTGRKILVGAFAGIVLLSIIFWIWF